MTVSTSSSAPPNYVRGTPPSTLDLQGITTYLARELLKIEIATRLLSERLTKAGF